MSRRLAGERKVNGLLYRHRTAKIKIRFAFLAALLGALGACAYQNSTLEPDHPIARKFTWFSYLAGDDIRSGCISGSKPHYRFVYNAIYTEQVRAYDLIPAAEAGRYHVKTQVTDQANLANISTDFSTLDLIQPWRPKISVLNIAERELSLLNKALQKSNYFSSQPPDKNLFSIDFYWTVAACISGVFRFNAYLWPSKEFNDLRFVKLLKRWDFTDIPFNPPRSATAFDVYGTNNEDEYVNYFSVKFDSDGKMRIWR